MMNADKRSQIDRWLFYFRKVTALTALFAGLIFFTCRMLPKSPAVIVVGGVCYIIMVVTVLAYVLTQPVYISGVLLPAVGICGIGYFLFWTPRSTSHIVSLVGGIALVAIPFVMLFIRGIAFGKKDQVQQSVGDADGSAPQP